MGLFDFFKDSGEEVIEKEKTTEKSAEELSIEAAKAIATFIERQSLGIEDLKVSFDAGEGKVTLQGCAPSQEACEKAALAAGNIKGIANVENNLTVAEEGERGEVRYHDVKSGETLSAIAAQYYQDANQYMRIFEANKPMLTDPNKIYPGQKLRIPL